MTQTMTYRSNLYKCSKHDCWLELRNVSTSVGTFHFWQCPVYRLNSRCQTCKPCKSGEHFYRRDDEKVVDQDEQPSA